MRPLRQDGGYVWGIDYFIHFQSGLFCGLNPESVVCSISCIYIRTSSYVASGNTYCDLLDQRCAAKHQPSWMSHYNEMEFSLTLF